MFNPDDAYYIGQDLPSLIAYGVGVVFVVLMGWGIEKGKK